eukprot:1193945-Prorocentrum_minimum.AAC.1
MSPKPKPNNTQNTATKLTRMPQSNELAHLPNLLSWNPRFYSACGATARMSHTDEGVHTHTHTHELPGTCHRKSTPTLHRFGRTLPQRFYVDVHVGHPRRIRKLGWENPARDMAQTKGDIDM